MANAALDERLAPFEGNPVLLSTGQSLLQYVDELNEFNEKYSVDSDEETGEYGTLYKQIGYTKKLADEPDEGTPQEKVTEAQKLSKAIANARDKLNAANRAAAEFAASDLGISVGKEKVEVPKEEKEQITKSVREPAVTLANTLVTLATALKATDGATHDLIVEWLAKYPIPQVGRKGKLDVTDIKEQAPRYRVDITAKDSDGNVLFENVAGFTKAAAQKNTPTAEEFRQAYENNGKKTTEFSDKNGNVYTIVPRT